MQKATVITPWLCGTDAPVLEPLSQPNSIVTHSRDSREPIAWIPAPLPGESRADLAARVAFPPIGGRAPWSELTDHTVPSHWYLRKLGFTPESWDAGISSASRPCVCDADQICAGDMFGRWVVVTPELQSGTVQGLRDSYSPRLLCRCDHGGSHCRCSPARPQGHSCPYMTPVRRMVLVSSLITVGSTSCGCWRTERHAYLRSVTSSGSASHAS
jgi:hypothetical protein